MLAAHVPTPTPPSGFGHAFVHEPQCSGLLVVSTHAPLQLVWFVGHVRLHVPALHVGALAPHTLAHVPQCAGCEGSTHEA